LIVDGRLSWGDVWSIPERDLVEYADALGRRAERNRQG
jgi:hypothetical protein